MIPPAAEADAVAGASVEVADTAAFVVEAGLSDDELLLPQDEHPITANAESSKIADFFITSILVLYSGSIK